MPAFTHVHSSSSLFADICGASWLSSAPCIRRVAGSNPTLAPRGRNLGASGGAVPPKFEVGGTAHAFVPPNILRSSVVGCARKYEKSKKGVFLVRKGSCTKGHVRHATK